MNIPATMKAAVLFDFNDVRVVERNVPSPGPEDALVKIRRQFSAAESRARDSGWEVG